jgi:hypothetical protein
MSNSSISNFVVSYGGKDANIDVIYRDGHKFYNATKLNQAFGTGKDSERVNPFLLKDATRAFILQKYTELKGIEEKTKEIKGLQKGSVGTFLDMDAVRSYLSNTHKESLPSEIVEPFVISKKGRGGATYLLEDLFLDYAMYLSPQIKSVVIEVFRKYGWVEFLPQEKRSDALLELTIQEEMKNVPDSQTILKNDAHPKAKRNIATARVEGKVTTNLLTSRLANVMGLSSSVEDQQTLASYCNLMFGTIYQCLFKHNAKKMLGHIEKTSGTPRDYMTEECLSAIAIVEAELKMELLQRFNQGHRLTQEALITLTKECSEKPAKNLFKYQNEIDFLFAEIKQDKNTVKCIDVALNSQYDTDKKEVLLNTITRLPITENTPALEDHTKLNANKISKQIETKNSNMDKEKNQMQLSLFDFND